MFFKSKDSLENILRTYLMPPARPPAPMLGTGSHVMQANEIPDLLILGTLSISMSRFHG